MTDQSTRTHTQRTRTKSYAWFIAFALLFTMIGLTAGYGLQALAEQGETTPQAAESREQMAPADLYENCVPSTVGITTSENINLWGYSTPAAASGSGIILTEDGYVLTNFHVITKSDSISVSTYDGKDYEAKLIGFDESNDIALLKIDASGLKPAVIGDSDLMRVGDVVMAIGNPLGELTFSMTSGIVSALDREITVEGGVMMDLIQTDAAINSGNSGGALFNAYGEVVGITNAKYSGSGNGREASVDNIGFAIPVNNVRGLVETLIQKGYVAKPYIGVNISDVSKEMKAYGLPEGAVIRSVEPDSPAARAGLEQMDIIVSVNGTELNNSSDLIEIVRKAKENDELKLEVFRRGEKMEVSIIVAELRKTTEDLEKERQEMRGKDQMQSGDLFPDGFPWNFGFIEP